MLSTKVFMATSNKNEESEKYFCGKCQQYKNKINFTKFQGIFSPRCVKCLIENQEEIMKNRIIKKYILYLHPHPNSPQYPNLSQYWKQAREVEISGIPNDALKYPFHITLTSVFETSDPETIMDRIRQAIVSFKNTGRLVTDLKLNSKLSGETETMGISVTSPKVSKLLGWLKMEFPFISCPSRNSLHLTLYSGVKTSEAKRFQEKMDLLPLEEWTDEWCFVLWEVEENAFKKHGVVCFM